MADVFQILASKKFNWLPLKVAKTKASQMELTVKRVPLSAMNGVCTFQGSAGEKCSLKRKYV